MVTTIVYDTEFYEDGVTIAPLSIAMRRSDGAELYAVSDSLHTMARAAEDEWLRDNVLRWLPITIEMSSGYGVINANVAWDDEHPDYGAIRTLDEIRDMVEDFVLAMPDPELWADYAAYDHVFYAQLFGRMVDLPNGMPMYTNELQQRIRDHGYTDTEVPLLPDVIVQKRFGGERKPHHAMYDVYEEQFRLDWVSGCPRR